MPRSYTVTALLTAFLATSCIVIFCFIVDPYKLFPEVPHLSPDTSVSLFYRMRLHTPYDVERVRPSILIAGDSRSAALPPQLLQKPGEIAYNASLPGATLRELRSMVEHAHAINPLKLVVIGADQPMFLEGASDGMRLDEQNRYRKINPGLSKMWEYQYQRLEDYWRSLLSTDAMMDAWRIVFGQGPSNLEYRYDGTWSMEGPVAGRPDELYKRLVQQIYQKQSANKSKPIEFGEFDDLLDFTESNGIQTILLILPMQGMLMNTIEFAGAWNQYLEWQRELVTRVDARNTDTEIYGLENRPAIVLESLSDPQRLFRDGVHFTRRAGIEVFTCLESPCTSGFQPSRLTRESVDAYLDKVDELRKQYAREYPADITKTRRWLKLDRKASN